MLVQAIQAAGQLLKFEQLFVFAYFSKLSKFLQALIFVSFRVFWNCADKTSVIVNALWLLVILNILNLEGFLSSYFMCAIFSRFDPRAIVRGIGFKQ